MSLEADPESCLTNIHWHHCCFHIIVVFRQKDLRKIFPTLHPGLSGLCQWGFWHVLMFWHVLICFDVFWYVLMCFDVPTRQICFYCCQYILIPSHGVWLLQEFFLSCAWFDCGWLRGLVFLFHYYCQNYFNINIWQ